MGKKKEKKENPVLKQKYDEGYQAGFEAGRDFERNVAMAFFAKQFHNMHNVKGFGEKTIEKFRKHFGERYFENK